MLFKKRGCSFRTLLAAWCNEISAERHLYVMGRCVSKHFEVHKKANAQARALIISCS